MIKKILVIIILVFISIILSICIGNVFISPKEIISIFIYKIFSPNLIYNKISADIIFNIRLPRSILAFFVGASLSLTGIVMQSILRNPLASVYNLGISSGAGLGASLLIITGINFNQYFISAISTLFAFITIIFILFIACRIDKYMNNNSIILAGIVISLFLYSLMSFFIYIFPKYSNRIILWQLGNLYLKNFLDILIIILITIIFLIVL
ncbi:FecCD family ABC transporter permease, partial [Brachyspira sp.]|uniref:FecCD family ABC transporter permease n=1 Tax=Brachyspira sp. TaxID=1977261 RepID=UPI003D7EF7C4